MWASPQSIDAVKSPTVPPGWRVKLNVSSAGVTFWTPFAIVSVPAVSGASATVAWPVVEVVLPPALVTVTTTVYAPSWRMAARGDREAAAGA